VPPPPDPGPLPAQEGVDSEDVSVGAYDRAVVVALEGRDWALLRPADRRVAKGDHGLLETGRQRSHNGLSFSKSSRPKCVGFCRFILQATELYKIFLPVLET